MNNNKADGLDALASAAAGTQSDEQMRAHISSKETGSSTAHPDASAPQGLTLSNLNPHQQQLLAEFVKNHSSSPAANNSKAVNASPSASSSLLGNLSQMNANSNNPLATLQGLQQQIASQQLLQLLMNRTAQASGGASSNHTPKQAPPAAPTGSTHGNNYLDSQNLHKLQALLSGIQAQSNLDELARSQVLPTAQPSTTPLASASSNNNNHGGMNGTTMPPPPPQRSLGYNSSITSQGAVSVTNTDASANNGRRQQAAIAPAPPSSNTSEDRSMDYDPFNGDKKQLKRAANRKSAQLSRRRKKMFMEELKDENDDLRRKEQILKSIPDLIVVFDSTGKLWFVSESVSNFVKYSAHELEGSSIWDRLCKDSVRLLKAAFMDSLAARQTGSNTAPLGKGFWELRLVDRDGSHKVITLNGVVHFAGERPECVCSIRPSDEHNKVGEDDNNNDEATHQDAYYRSLIRVKPYQSVVSNGSSDSSSSGHQHNSNKRAFQHISDSGHSGSSIGESEETGSGRDD